MNEKYYIYIESTNILCLKKYFILLTICNCDLIDHKFELLKLGYILFYNLHTLYKYV